MAERVLRVTASGAVTGAFIVAEERRDESLVIVPDLSDEAMCAEWGTNPNSVENYKRAVTAGEFAKFETRRGTPDSEG
jgi:hypothetical protein